MHIIKPEFWPKYIIDDNDAFNLQIDEIFNSKIIKNIRNYFGKIKDDKKKLINKIIFTKAIRKLISRYIVGTRQETDIKPEIELKLQIDKPELWPKNIIDDNDNFTLQIDEIFKSKINVEQSLELYNSLQGDENQFKKSKIVYEEQEKEKEMNDEKKVDLVDLKSINIEIINESYYKDNIKIDKTQSKAENDKNKIMSIYSSDDNNISLSNNKNNSRNKFTNKNKNKKDSSVEITDNVMDSRDSLTDSSKPGEK